MTWTEAQEKDTEARLWLVLHVPWGQLELLAL